MTLAEPMASTVIDTSVAASDAKLVPLGATATKQEARALIPE